MVLSTLPTLGPLLETSRRTALRFPLVLASGMMAAWAGIAMMDGAVDEQAYVRIMVTAALGLPLFFGLTLFAERRLKAVLAQWALFGGGALILAGFWAFWPQWTETIRAARFVQLSIVLHLMVSFLPYAGVTETSGFWTYNKTLFLRFLTSALYTVVMFAGLAIAFASLDKLFGLDVPGEAYGRLWVVMAFVLNTWLFVGGVPEDLPALEMKRDYPAGLRVFTQYILLPLVVIYLAILTLYFVKVMVTREWPSGWIGYLVSSVAVVGILAWLLVRPLEDFAEHAWVKSYTRGFYIAIMPAVVMLWLAIGKRVGQYGITERRYFLIVLSLWLGGIAAFYTVRRTRNITIIPASLCLVGLLTFVGPWGAYQVSRRSQTNRLERVLVANGVLSAGVVQRATREVSPGDRGEVSATLSYLIGTHGMSALPGWMSDSIRVRMNRTGAGSEYGATDARVRVAMEWLAIPYARPSGGAAAEWFSYYGSRLEPTAIAGYQYALVVDEKILTDSIAVADAFLVFDRTSKRLLLRRRGEVLVEMSVQPVIDTARARSPRASYRQGSPALKVESRSGSAGILALFTSINGQTTRDSSSVSQLGANVFVRLP